MTANNTSKKHRIPCQYVVARFVPDEIRNEPINIGVILQPNTQSASSFMFLSSFDRVSLLLSHEKVTFLATVVEGLTKDLKGKHLDKPFLESLSREYRHNLQFTDVRGALCDDPKTEVAHLFKTFVSMDPGQDQSTVRNSKGASEE